MSTRKRHRAKQNLFRQIRRLSINSLTRIFKWLLRCYVLLLRGISRRQAHLAKSGFILPTVAMVTLIVVLLTTALVFRSFDRAGKASNVRVSQAVMKAAEPALDRARAKIDALFNDPKLPRTTPSDLALYNAFISNKYTLGDETRLKLAFDINNTDGIQKKPGTDYKLEDDETLNTAWKFPVDTDNNGKFDSYTLYGIYFRNPSRNTDGQFNRARNPLEARTLPMTGSIGSECANASDTSASLIGDSSWFKSSGKLIKNFFVYTTTVPITSDSTDTTNYEKYTGNTSFSALEFQQDRSRIPLVSNAALFQDDIILTPGPSFYLNGRVFTNGNLLLGGDTGVRLFQVSSAFSCFYKEENSKITVGGNVANGGITDTDDNAADVTVDLFKGAGVPVGPGISNTTDTISGTNKSVNVAGGNTVAYNDAAYNKRIALMKEKALTYSTNGGTVTSYTNLPTISSVNAVTQYPSEVKVGFEQKLTASGGSSNAQDVLAEEIEIYLRNHTRRVPYGEITSYAGTSALGSYTSSNVFASGTIEPPLAWREITNTSPLSLLTAQLPQTQPEKQQEEKKEKYVGDRILVGNNLPAYWEKDGVYVSGSNEKQFLDTTGTIKWTEPNTERRYRTTRVEVLPDLGVAERNGFWEDAAAQKPESDVSNVGGLRVITGAGIYADDDGSAGTPSFARNTYSFLSNPTWDTSIVSNPASIEKFTTASINSGNENIVAWTDLMPMTGGVSEIAGSNRKGDLLMRATAVYHHKDSSYTVSATNSYLNRTPLACVSSYFDPTNATTAKNKLNHNAGYGVDTTNGRSNNGIVYSAPYSTDSARITEVGTYRTQLNGQARLVFPNGRIVNQPLRDALKKIDASGTRSLADNSALDTAICSLKILDGTLSVASSPPIPHGAIKEAAFLEGREVKAIDKTTGSSEYDLELEQRQPLEIRVTDLDMNQLRTTTIGGSTRQEYLLPNSGLIYATRNDGLLDLSDSNTDISTKKLLSPTDFKVDPTRRPNGIRLINGSNLARVNAYREEEKGLILVSDLAVFVKADFNLHQTPIGTAVEEFENPLDADWGDFYTRGDGSAGNGRDNNFACRSGQTGCATASTGGDTWRQAAIYADAVKLLSSSFQDGFRNQGDFDLGNNASSNVASTRKKIGFWNNGFVTSADWADSNGFASARNSYLTNGVTPVQRRVNFPEYLMEVCTKLPVSECSANDWYVNPETNLKASDPTVIGAAFNISTHKAGTTATLAAADYRRYPRRIAVLRRTDGTSRLIFTDSTNKSNPIPIGINSTGNITPYPYQDYSNGATTYNAYNSSTNNKPRNSNSTLWYRTSSDANDPTNRIDRSTDRYGKNFPLQYLAGSGLLLPDTVCVKKTETPGSTEKVGSLVACPDPPSWNSTIANLNLPSSDKASGYATCIFSNSKNAANKKYKTNEDVFDITPKVACPGNNADTSTVSGVITGTRDILSALTSPLPSGSLTSAGGTLTANADVNVYTLPGGFNNNVTITLKNTTSYPNPVFVLKASGGSFEFGSNSCGSMPPTNCNGVRVVLEGVEANNVFWILDTANVKFHDVNTAVQVNAAIPPGTLWGHQIKGTVFGKASMHMGNNTEIEGRLLGNSNAVQFTNGGTSNITAIVSSDQPLFIPVLQIHSPQGIPGDSTTNLPDDGKIEEKWTQLVTAATSQFNAAFVAGNMPSRPEEKPDDFENFVRFLESWRDPSSFSQKRNMKIQGSFIQLKRSTYATGSAAAVLNKRKTPGNAAYNTGEMSVFNYKYTAYKNDETGDDKHTNETPYIEAPNRLWGFDVAILSQPSDLFSERFSTLPTAPPNEYFRQVGRDDLWVQYLLCGAEDPDGDGDYSYSIDSSERPSVCPALEEYEDDD